MTDGIYPAGTRVRVLHHTHLLPGKVYTITEPGLNNGGYTLGPEGGMWHVSEPQCEVLSPRERIWVYAYGLPESSAGFQWIAADRDPGGRRWLMRKLDEDSEFPEGYGVLAELHMAGYAPDDAGRQRVTDLIEGELQDAIGAGLVGKILGRY